MRCVPAMKNGAIGLAVEIFSQLLILVPLVGGLRVPLTYPLGRGTSFLRATSWIVCLETETESCEAGGVVLQWLLLGELWCWLSSDSSSSNCARLSWADVHVTRSLAKISFPSNFPTRFLVSSSSIPWKAQSTLLGFEGRHVRLISRIRNHDDFTVSTKENCSILRTAFTDWELRESCTFSSTNSKWSEIPSLTFFRYKHPKQSIYAMIITLLPTIFRTSHTMRSFNRVVFVTFAAISASFEELPLRMLSRLVVPLHLLVLLHLLVVRGPFHLLRW